MSGLTLLTDQPIRIAVECEVCWGEGKGSSVYKSCPNCKGRGFNLTKTGREIVRVLKPYILEDTES